MGNSIADKRIFFLINPKAGGGTAGAWWEDQRRLLEQSGIDFFYEFTTDPASAAGQIRRAVLDEGAAALMIVGGDGSLYDAVNGIIENGQLIRPGLIFGVCPVGSGCDFARYIYGGRIPSLTDLIRRGRVGYIDVGCCEYAGTSGVREQRYFVNSFDMGAGADTCAQVNAGNGRIKRVTRNGKLSFLLTALKVLLSFNYTRTVIEADGQVYDGEYIIAGAANGRFIGGGMMMFPEALLDDGKLDLLLVERRGKLKILRAFPLIYSGRHLSQPGITYVKASGINIKTDRPIHIELDGEVPGHTDVSLSVIRGVLPLLLPASD
ncbi:MAG: diacylglycerol kinase family lipid kinase [Firmicutes bacterium]|nr:diacylglycerol kinase family lipid kinase [Bacillota bacterium]